MHLFGRALRKWIAEVSFGLWGLLSPSMCDSFSGEWLAEELQLFIVLHLLSLCQDAQTEIERCLTGHHTHTLKVFPFEFKHAPSLISTYVYVLVVHTAITGKIHGHLAAASNYCVTTYLNLNLGLVIVREKNTNMYFCCVYNNSRYMYMLLYASFNHDAPSAGFIFTVCSKYTRALLHTYLIGWGLISFPVWEEVNRSSDVVTVFCYTLSMVDCHSACVTVTFLSCLSWCQTCLRKDGHDLNLLLGDERKCTAFLCQYIDVSVLCLGSGNHLKSYSLCVFFISFLGVELSLWWLLHLSKWIVVFVSLPAAALSNVT